MAEADWLRLQKKIFGRYVNQKLRQEGSNIVVNDLIKDVKDGLALINLVEILSGKTFPGKKPNPTTQRIQQLDNCTKAVNFMKDCGIKTQASSNDIVDANEKLILGTVFQIIIKYMKLDEDDVGQSTDVRDALMLWLKNKTAGYAGVKIENFTKSFHDGLAFCALIHKLRPKLIPYDTLKADDKTKNLELALSTAEKYCNVEKYLEPSDIPKLDELSMVVYLSDWYYGVALLQKQDAAARRVGKLVVMTKLHDQMRAEYAEKSSALVSWIDSTITKLETRAFDNTLEGAKQKLSEYYDYKSKEKGDKITEHMDIDSLYNNLALRLHNNNRPEYSPPAGLSLKEIQAKLEKLEEAENARSIALHAELARQIKLDNMAKRFHEGGEKFALWIAEKEKYLNAKEAIDSIAKAQLHLNFLEAYNKEQANVNDTRWATLKSLAAEIIADKYQHSNAISAKQSELEGKFSNLSQLSQKKQKVLEDDLTREKHKEKLRIEFAQVANDFERWANDQIQICADSYFGETLESVQEHGTVVKKSEDDIAASIFEREGSYNKIWEELQQYQVKDNNYTVLGKSELDSIKTRLHTEVQSRRKAYQAELDRQIANDKMCKEFAEKVKAFNEWLSNKKESINNNADLEDQLKAVESSVNDQSEANGKLQAIDDLDKKMQEAQITNNKYSNITANDVRTAHQQFQQLLRKKKVLLEQEIQNKKKHGVSDDQMKEIKDNFSYFDKDNSNFLDRRELRVCLQSLGEEATPQEVLKILQSYDKDGDGKISLDEFTDLMIKKLGDSDTKEEILNSFKLINGGKEIAMIDYLRAVVNDLTFKDEYADYLQKEMSPQDGGLNYKKWTEEVFAR